MPQTQGSSFLATLGFETESLRDSQFEKVCGRMARLSQRAGATSTWMRRTGQL
jgi:hypothetical protein